ncbi:MAG: MFS transporter [Pseudomonadota bacterium]
MSNAQTINQEAPQDSALLSGTRLYLLAFASAIVTANAYYIHPIVAMVAEDFGVGKALIGAVPALNQIALAVGIFFLLPLGDRLGNAKLAAWFSAAQFISVVIMALAGNFALFVIGSMLLGLFTITPYLVPAYVSKRTDPAKMGHAMAVLTTGIILGILGARLGAGLVGEYFGWRNVYYIAAVLMLVFSVLLPMIMRQPRSDSVATTDISYGALLASTLPMAWQYKHVLLSGTIQGLNFGIFLSLWMGIGLHLPTIGYGSDVVGYLTAIAIVNLFSTPMLGRWSDRVGATRARMMMAMVQMVGVALLFFSSGNIWLLIVPIVILNIVGPVIDIAGRASFLTETPEIRTRLMTIYIMLMFIGGGLASWAGTAVYAAAGWFGTAMLVLVMSTLVLALSFMGMRQRSS